MKKLNIYSIYLDLMLQELIKLLELKTRRGKNHLNFVDNKSMVNTKILQIYLKEKIGLKNLNQN